MPRFQGHIIDFNGIIFQTNLQSCYIPAVQCTFLLPGSYVTDRSQVQPEALKN